MEQVGDKRFYKDVSILAKMHATSESERQIKEAAENCLPFLEARKGVVSAHATLLRPSNQQTASSTELLRPAKAASETSTDELLRPLDEND